MENLDLLFLGRMISKDREHEVKNKMKTGMVDAANALQWNLIDGFIRNGQSNITVINYLPVDSFPNGYKDYYIRRVISRYENSSVTFIDVEHLNLTVVKQITNIIPYKKEVDKWISNNNKGRKVVFIYSAQPLSLKLAKYIKSKDSSIKTVCMIADIPEYNTIGNLHGIRKLFNQYEVSATQKLYSFIDKFVLLTNQMHKKLKLVAPYIVIEGIASNSDVECDNSLSRVYDKTRYLFYSGTLNYKFGICTLLDAFSKINDPEIKLIICGFGEAEQCIKNSEDDRVIFLGKIDRKQVLALQKSATVLVNPRQNNEDFTKYSFPSKTMEYLASGTPVVAYKLDGIPDEYDQYINYVPNDSADALATTIMRIMSLNKEEREFIGNKSKRFVKYHKNSEVQCRKILEFIVS